MITHRLNMLGMRYIMLNKSLNIPAPYRGDANQRSWMTGWLRERFQNLFGADFPKPQVV